MTEAPSDPPSANQPALLTPTTLATLGGLTTAVLVIMNSIHMVTGWTSGWLGLLLAIMLALVVEFAFSQANADRPRFARATLGVINGCLVFTTALGGNQIGSRVTEPVQPTFHVDRVNDAAKAWPTPTSIRVIRDSRFFHDWLD